MEHLGKIYFPPNKGTGLIFPQGIMERWGITNYRSTLNIPQRPWWILEIKRHMEISKVMGVPPVIIQLS